MLFEDRQPFERLVQAMRPGAMLLRAGPLAGGVSAWVTALEVMWPDGAEERLVVRQHGPRDLAANPEVARHEFELLAYLTDAGLPVPAPLHLSPAGEAFETPALVTSFVEGEALDPSHLETGLDQLALFLRTLHGLPDSARACAFLPGVPALSPPPARLDESLSEGRIRDALRTNSAPEHRPVLLHGDFWPGNMLWRSHRLAAVIDWENAGLGDPLSDVANARLELLWAYGEAAMRRFTAVYGGGDARSLAYWDLRAALRPVGRLEGWGLAPATLDSMRARHRTFVEAAFERLTSA